MNVKNLERVSRAIDEYMEIEERSIQNLLREVDRNLDVNEVENINFKISIYAAMDILATDVRGLSRIKKRLDKQIINENRA